MRVMRGNNDHKIWKFGTIIVMTLVMAVVLQWVQEYRFYAKECEHLWLNDWMWIAPHFAQPGGSVQLLTSAITQFFCLKWVGATSLAIVFGLVLLIAHKIQQKLDIAFCFLSLWLFPIGFMFLCNEHTYFNLRGHFAILLSLLISYWLIVVYEKVNEASITKALSAAVAVLFAYWLVGSMSVIIAEMTLAHVLIRRKDWILIVVSILSYLLVAGILTTMHFFANLEEALTPAQYYEWPASYSTPMLVWLILPFVPILGSYLSSRLAKTAAKAGWVNPLVMAVSMVLSIAVITDAYSSVHNSRVYQLRQDEWNARCGNWDAIISSHKGTREPTAFISYLNLALAKRGMLVQRMTEFNPYILWSDEAKMYSPVLMVNDELSRDALKLQSCVFMEWGGEALANAQKSAFEANFLTPGETDPVELQRLVLTNSLFDTNHTARKYLRRLARTTMYAHWAEARLADESLVDDEVEAMARTLPVNDGFYKKTQVGKMLRQIVMQNPRNSIASQFYEAYLIQSCDSVAYRHWKEFLNTNNASR